MANRSKTVGKGYYAAVQRFPGQKQTISELMKRSEQFTEICEELADAETALADLADLPQNTRRERRAEWNELISRLISEIEACIRQ